MALVLDPRLCQRVLWIQICPSVRPSVRRSVYKAFFFRIGSLLFSGFHALDFWDIEPDDRNKKSSKSDNFGFLRKILVISKVGEIGHFGTQNQHTWAFLLFFSLNRLWSCTWSYTLLIWPNCWVFVYELSGSGFESSCSHLNFRFRSCFEQGVPWHSGKHRVWFHSETRTWHDKNIQTETQVCISLHLQADQQCKSLTTQVVFLITRSFSVHAGTTKVHS